MENICKNCNKQLKDHFISNSFYVKFGYFFCSIDCGEKFEKRTESKIKKMLKTWRKNYL